jgi:hypothetical protein
MKALYCWGLSVLALFAVACGGDAVSETPAQAAPGTLELPLTASGPEGTYRLVGATFVITGPQSVNVTDTSADTVSVPLAAGAYTVQLAGNWQLERVENPGQAVQATLVSPNPLSLVVDEGQVRTVRFLFKVAAAGSADVGITVDSGGWITGTLQLNGLEGSVPNIFQEVYGRTVPFTISYQTATLIRMDYGEMKELRVRTGPVSVQFGGAPSLLLHERIEAALEGYEAEFSLTATANGQVKFLGLHLAANATFSEPFIFELGAGPSFPGPLGRDGYPAVGPFKLEGQGALRLFSYGSSSAGASGPASGTIIPY